MLLFTGIGERWEERRTEGYQLTQTGELAVDDVTPGSPRFRKAN